MPNPPADPRVRLLLLLSVTTGLVDAASVLGLGKVFTANMTGNVVLLGFAVAGAPDFHWPPYIVAIASFMVGAVVAGRIGKHYVGGSTRRWLRTTAMIETLLIWIAALVAIDLERAPPDPIRLFAIIAPTAFAMGVRNATVRRLNVADLMTTVLTRTITGLAADSRLAGGDGINWRRRVGAVAAIFIGAVIGAALCLHIGVAAPLALAGIVILPGTYGFTARLA